MLYQLKSVFIIALDSWNINICFNKTAKNAIKPCWKTGNCL